MAKFKKGQSGNPDGKPKGAKDKRTEYRKLLEPHAEALIQKAVSLALKGDSTALKLCLDRLVSAVKPVSEPLRAVLPTTGTLSDQGAAIFQAAATCKISADDAAALMAVLQGQVRVTEFQEIEQRLCELENEIKGQRNEVGNKNKT